MVMRGRGSGHPFDDEVVSGGGDVHLHPWWLAQAQRAQPRSFRSTKYLLGRRGVHIVNEAAGDIKRGRYRRGFGARRGWSPGHGRTPSGAPGVAPKPAGGAVQCSGCWMYSGLSTAAKIGFARA